MLDQVKNEMASEITEKLRLAAQGIVRKLEHDDILYESLKTLLGQMTQSQHRENMKETLSCYLDVQKSQKRLNDKLGLILFMAENLSKKKHNLTMEDFDEIDECMYKVKTIFTPEYKLNSI